jgi:hypothetical protein
MWDSGEVRLGTVPPLWSDGALVELLIFCLFSVSTFFWVLPGSASGWVTLHTNWLSSSAILRCCKVVVWILLSISLLRSCSEKVKVYIWLFIDIQLNKQPFKMRGMLMIMPHEHDGTVTCTFISLHALTRNVIFEASTVVNMQIIILITWLGDHCSRQDGGTTFLQCAGTHIPVYLMP